MQHDSERIGCGLTRVTRSRPVTIGAPVLLWKFANWQMWGALNPSR